MDLSPEEALGAQALCDQGWSISAIARHLGRDRKTIRRYLSGERELGQRKPAGPDPFEPFVAYCRTWLADDPICGRPPCSTSSPTWAIKALLHIHPCAAPPPRAPALRSLPGVPRPQRRDHRASAGRGNPIRLGRSAEPPSAVGCRTARTYSSARWRIQGGGGGVLVDAEDFPHLVEALETGVRKLGGTTHDWRFDRMATVCYPSSGRFDRGIRPSRQALRDPLLVCPLRRGNGKGVVGKRITRRSQRWWRTVAATIAEAQTGLGRLAVKLDDRRRVRGGEPTTVAARAVAATADGVSRRSSTSPEQ